MNQLETTQIHLRGLSNHENVFGSIFLPVSKARLSLVYWSVILIGIRARWYFLDISDLCRYCLYAYCCSWGVMLSDYMAV